MQRFTLLSLTALALASCDDGSLDRGDTPRLDEQPALDDWTPTIEPFVLPTDGAEVLEAPLDANANLVIEVPTDGGTVRFVDRAAALGLEDGGIAVIAFGAAAHVVAALMEAEDATALEIYLALAEQRAPERLLEDHARLAEADDRFPAQPRDLRASMTFRLTPTYDNLECPPAEGYNFWTIGWKAWSSSYGNQISCTSVEQNIDLLTWSSAKRALGACYHDCDGCTNDWATMTYYGWTGFGWQYLDGPFSFSGTGYGQAIYYGYSGLVVGQDKGLVRGVEPNEETIYVGVRSQISGGSDQC